MGVTIGKADDKPAGKYIAPERLYRTADDEVCAEDDPRVAFVIVNVGHQVPDKFVDKVKAYLDERDNGGKPRARKAKPEGGRTRKPKPESDGPPEEDPSEDETSDVEEK